MRQIGKWNQPVNVAQVPQRSPFRYPGGKTWLIPTLRRWLNFFKPRILVEPFAGGGIVSLTAVAESYVEKAIMVEIDEDVSAVWQTILNGHFEWLMERIADFTFNYENVRNIIDYFPPNCHERAFRTIIRNRAARGGILADGAGLTKKGENGKGISSRWYPMTLVKRIRNINSLHSKIDFIKGDGLPVIEAHLDEKDTALFLDPPYVRAGRRLYSFSEIDHMKLFVLASRHRGPCLFTYEDSKEIIYLAEKNGFCFRRVAMQNTHLTKKNELLIAKDFEWLETEP
jgi:DNA adenine methylase